MWMRASVCARAHARACARAVWVCSDANTGATKPLLHAPAALGKAELVESTSSLAQDPIPKGPTLKPTLIRAAAPPPAGPYSRPACARQHLALTSRYPAKSTKPKRQSTASHRCAFTAVTQVA